MPWAILKFRRRNDLRIKAYFRKNWIDTQPDVYCRAIYETLSTFSLWIHLNKSSFLFAIWKFLVSHFKVSFLQVLRISVSANLISRFMVNWIYRDVKNVWTLRTQNKFCTFQTPRLYVLELLAINLLEFSSFLPWSL